MKNLNFYTLIISVFVFLSCEKKKDPEPVVPVLKAFSTEGTTPNRTVKSSYSLVYNNEKLSNLQRIDTIIEVGSPVRTVPTLNNIFTEEASGGYKLISDFATGGANGYTLSKVENIAQKTANGYDIITTYSSSLAVHSQLELNTNNQVVKYITTKIVNTNQNGVKRETPQNAYYRYEYDAKGNVIKAFLKGEGATTEVLSNEYTYDDKPNPYKDLNLRWIFRLSGLGGAGGIESVNNVLTSKSYQQGILFAETIGVYTYDNQSGYPLTLTTSGKSYSPNASVGTGKTIFKY
jgi:hypothetical protein